MRRLVVCAAVAVCAFGVSAALTADADDATGDVELSVNSAALGITITGDQVDFGGPHSPGGLVRTSNAGVTQPVVENSGNLPIDLISVSFDGPVGEEATCDEGSGSWAADTETGVDQFRLQTVLGTTDDLFSGYVTHVLPESGSGNALLDLDSPVAPGSSVDMYIVLRLPTVTTTGADGCTIGLSVMAATNE